MMKSIESTIFAGVERVFARAHVTMQTLRVPINRCRRRAVATDNRQHKTHMQIANIYRRKKLVQT